MTAAAGRTDGAETRSTGQRDPGEVPVAGCGPCCRPGSVATRQSELMKARFQREAQLPASLDHATIAALCGSEKNALGMDRLQGSNLRVPRIDITSSFN